MPRLHVFEGARFVQTVRPKCFRASMVVVVQMWDPVVGVHPRAACVVCRILDARCSSACRVNLHLQYEFWAWTGALHGDKRSVSCVRAAGGP